MNSMLIFKRVSQQCLEHVKDVPPYLQKPYVKSQVSCSACLFAGFSIAGTF